jgi:transposase
VAADASGYTRLLRFVRVQAPDRRVWAIEGTGGFGAGLTSFLLEQTEWVVEVDRPSRPARRDGAKSDQLDAARAAREALSRQHLAQPRRRGNREALRVLLATREGAILARTQAIGQLKGLIINAPDQLRQQLRQLTTNEQLSRCARLRTSPGHSTEYRATIIALRSTARRALALKAEAAELEAELELLVHAVAPALLAEPGVGVITAAHLISAWSHPGRFRSDGRLRLPRRRRTDRRLLRPNHPPPTQPRWRPPPQPRPPHHRALPSDPAPSRPGNVKRTNKGDS